MKLNQDSPVPRALSAAMLAAIFLAGCSTIDETSSNVFSSDASATASFAGRVLFGKVNFTHAHEGTVQLQSDEGPSLGCLGNLRFTGSTGGVVVFACSDGQMVTVPFQSLSSLRGSGRTQNEQGVYALTYGLQPPMAAPFLGLPVERSVPPAARPPAQASSSTAAGTGEKSPTP